MLDPLRRADGVKGPRDNLTGAGLVIWISQPLFQQLGVSENDASWLFSWWNSLLSSGSVTYAPRRSGSSIQVSADAGSGPRHSVSAKIRTEPPAVLT